MSIFQSEVLTCPACGAEVGFDALFSISADRRPDLRDAILDDTLQRGGCETCGESFRLDPELTYLSIADGQWILAGPPSGFARWSAFEREAQSAFSSAYGDAAPPAARAIGAALTPRIAFGWAALREKLLARRHGLDDVALELLKLALLRGPVGERMADDRELRLVEVAGEPEAQVLTLAWLRGPRSEPIEGLRVPRDVYDGIAAGQKDFGAVREELAGGLFVDVNRLFVGAEATA